MAGDDYQRDKGNNSIPVLLTKSQRFDDIFAALADSRRRYVLHYLQNEERGSMTDVARQVVAWEHEVPADEIPDEVISEIKLLLYHNHLPKLREARLVEYDERSEQLLFRDPPELVETCLEHCAKRDLPD